MIQGHAAEHRYNLHQQSAHPGRTVVSAANIFQPYNVHRLTCPAFNHRCSKCHRQNHLEKVCEKYASARNRLIQLRKTTNFTAPPRQTAPPRITPNPCTPLPSTDAHASVHTIPTYYTYEEYSVVSTALTVQQATPPVTSRVPDPGRCGFDTCASDHIFGDIRYFVQLDKYSTLKPSIRSWNCSHQLP